MHYSITEDEEFDSYYVLKISTDDGERYYFSSRLFVCDIGLAHQFNTLRSVKRCMKQCKGFCCSILKLKREFQADNFFSNAQTIVKDMF